MVLKTGLEWGRCKEYANYINCSGHVEIKTLSEILNIRVCIHLENYISIETGPENIERKINLLSAHVTDTGHFSVLQEWDNMWMEIQFSETNTQISQVSDNKCM